MSETHTDIDALLTDLVKRSRFGWHTALAALVAERDALKRERDEARRDACAFEGIIRFNEKNPNGILSSGSILLRAKAIAAERGWDCYGEGGGA